MPSADILTRHYLVNLLLTFSAPGEILAAYLRRPLRRTSFRLAAEQVARGNFDGRTLPESLSPAELIGRAQQLLRWLDGNDLDGRNPYEVLGISCTASPQEILRRYRLLSKRVHPDRHPPARQDYWCARQQEVNRAYRVLTDPAARADYNARAAERRHLLRRLWEAERVNRF